MIFDRRAPQPRPDAIHGRARRAAARLGRRCRPQRELLEGRIAPASGAFAATGPYPPAEVATNGSKSLPLGLQYAASEALGASDSAYAMAADGAGYSLANGTNAYTARVDAGGFAVGTGEDSWSLTVAGVGYSGATTPLGSGVATASANRVEYDYGAISQWFVNGPLGLQQGFTLDQRPAGGGAGSPLTIDLALGGSLVATADPSGTSVTLARADGSSSLVYGGLIAYDAAGAAVPARMVATQTAGGTVLSILVDDADAVYPLTVDPYVQEARVNGSLAKPFQFFGASVAISPSGSLAAVGAISSNPTTIRGSVYIFTNNGTTWTRGAELTSSDGVIGDEFGNAIAMSADGSTLIVGARSLAVGGRAGQGAAYVFRRNDATGAWAQRAKLTSSDGAAGDSFGFAVDVNADGSIITIGSPLADTPGNADQGAAYIYAAASPTTWTQAAKLLAPDGAAGARYGYSITVDSAASMVAVGAPAADGTGAVYAYFQSTPVKLSASDAAAGDGLGYSLSTDDDGSFLLIGAPFADISGRADQGAAYIFSRSWNSWAQSAKLTAADGAAGDLFGASVAIDSVGGTAVAGAVAASTGGKIATGAAYVFERGDGNAWGQVAKLVASDATIGATLGQAVAVNNRTVLAGAPTISPAAPWNTQGAAYFFQNPTSLAVAANPTNRTAVVGVPTTFTAASVGPGGRTTRWQVSDDGTTWTNITGATRPWYTFTPTAADSGKRFRAIFTDADGDSVTTTSALLTVVKSTTVLTISNSLNPRRIGDSLAITVAAAGVIPGVATATGNVTLTLQRDGSADAPITIGPIALSGGQAVFNIPTQALGTYTVTATYAGDGAFNAATGTTSQVVVKGSTTLTAAVPANAVTGSRVTLVATLVASGGLGDMGGGIVVKDNGVPIGYPETVTVNGVTTATFTTPPLTAGGHYYQFMFLGNAQILASSTGVYAMQVGGAATSGLAAAFGAPAAGVTTDAGGSQTNASPSVSALATAAAVNAGIPTTLTAVATTVNPRFTQWQYRDQVGNDDQYWINVIDANLPWYTFTPTAAMQGRQYRAVFTNLGGEYEASAITTLNVTSGMAVQVSTSPNPRRLGDPMTITAVATAAASGVGPIAGGTMTVTIQRQGSTDAPLNYSGTPVNGLAVFNVPATLALGTYTVTATYSNPTFGVASATTSQVVVKGSTTLTASVPTSAAVGSRVTLVATLTAFGGLGDMGGGIVVKDNGVPIGYPETVTVNGVTTATFTTPPLTAGGHYYQFMFLGNAQILASSTGVYAMQVGGAATSGLAAARPTSDAASAAATSTTSTTAPAVDAVALYDAFADSSTKKTRTSSALTFWRSGVR